MDRIGKQPQVGLIIWRGGLSGWVLLACAYLRHAEEKSRAVCAWSLGAQPEPHARVSVRAFARELFLELLFVAYDICFRILLIILNPHPRGTRRRKEHGEH